MERSTSHRLVGSKTRPVIQNQIHWKPSTLLGRSLLLPERTQAVAWKPLIIWHPRMARCTWSAGIKSEGKRLEERLSKKTGSDKVHLVVGDCGVAADIRRVAKEIQEREKSLNCLLCNAGALLNKRQTTPEGLEVTFATHLAMGTYLLANELAPLLNGSFDGGRVVAVSSGGMYNVKYDHKAAMSEGSLASSYDGQLAYAYAKRGQVLLCERRAKEAKDKVTYVSCHPGWTDTPGVEAAYGSTKSWLQPLRTLWQGTEGICWLCIAPKAELQNGAFYLDRSPQELHIGGSRTKNTEKEVDQMMSELAKITGVEDKSMGA